MTNLIICVAMFYILHLFLVMSFSLHKVPFVQWTYTGGDISDKTALSERMASAGEIISEDAEEQASQRQAPDEDNIGERADFTGSTSDLQYDFELGSEEQRIEAEEDLEERSNSLASMGTR